MTKEFGVSATLVNLTIALYMLAMSIFPLWWSSFSETLGRRNMYVISFFLNILFCLLSALSVNIAMLIVFRMLSGGASASVQAVGAGTIADIWEPRERGRAMGIFYLGPLMGPMLGPVLGGVLAQYYGWRSTAYFLTVYGVIVFVLTLFVLPETLERRKSSPPSPPPTGPTAAADDNAPLDGLIFAAEDFALDLSLTRTPSLREFLYARSAIATAARAWSLPSAVDLVCTSFRGEEGAARLEEECRDGRGLGFNGKQCIHPDQVALVQRLFAPDQREVEWAVRVLIADEKAIAQGRGAFTLDGSMIDAPVSGKAKEVVHKAERCGMDVEELRQKWKDQEPE